MQATQDSRQSISLLHVVLKWVQFSLTLSGTGVMIAAVLTFQQFLLQLYATSWQVALLFALLGLMVALLLGQYLFQQDSGTSK